MQQIPVHMNSDRPVEHHLAILKDFLLLRKLKPVEAIKVNISDLLLFILSFFIP